MALGMITAIIDDAVLIVVVAKDQHQMDWVNRKIFLFCFKKKSIFLYIAYEFVSGRLICMFDIFAIVKFLVCHQKIRISTIFSSYTFHISNAYNFDVVLYCSNFNLFVISFLLKLSLLLQPTIDFIV